MKANNIVCLIVNNISSLIFYDGYATPGVTDKQLLEN